MFQIICWLTDCDKKIEDILNDAMADTNQTKNILANNLDSEIKIAGKLNLGLNPCKEKLHLHISGNFQNSGNGSDCSGQEIQVSYNSLVKLNKKIESIIEEAGYSPLSPTIREISEKYNKIRKMRKINVDNGDELKRKLVDELYIFFRKYLKLRDASNFSNSSMTAMSPDFAISNNPSLYKEFFNQNFDSADNSGNKDNNRTATNTLTNFDGNVSSVSNRKKNYSMSYES